MGTWLLDNLMAQGHPSSPGLPASLSRETHKLLFCLDQLCRFLMYTTDLVYIRRAGLPRSVWQKRPVLDMSRGVFTVLTTVGSQGHYFKLERGSWVIRVTQGNWRLLASHLSSHGVAMKECLGSPGVRFRSLCFFNSFITD